MSNKHITQFLDYYIALSNPQYAVLLKGKWGSGKTHFINEYKQKLDKNKKKYIYVSLYGVTSYDEIETKFLESSNPELFNNKTIYASKIANAFINEKIKDSINFFKKSLSILNSKDKILIFDDLERCSIDIINLLGYINYFVEHQSYNVILIANEEELDKNNNKYKNIKEKLIGKDFEFRCTPDLAYDGFLKELENKEKVKEEIFEKYKDLILKKFAESKFYNLRILRQWILEFERFYNEILKEHIEKEELITSIIKEYLCLTLEYKKNNSFFNELIEEINSNSFDSLKDKLLDDVSVEEKKDKLQNDLKTKYQLSLEYGMIMPLETWQDIIEKSNINKEEINLKLKNSVHYYDENTPNWKKLANFYDLEDKEFVDLLAKVYESFKLHEYNDYLHNKLVASMLLYLNEENLFKIDSDKLLEECKNVFNRCFQNDKEFTKKIVFNTHNRFFYDRNYNNIGYFSSNLFTKLNSSLKEMLKVEKEKILKNDSQKILDAIKKRNTDNLLFLLEGSIDKDAIFYRKEAILNQINPEELFQTLLKTNGTTMHFFGGILKDRYKNGFNQLLKIEKDFLTKLLDLVNEYISNNKGKLIAFNMKRELKENLKIAIEDIKN